MKVAIITDQLYLFGGQERVLQSLIKIFPKSHVYTSFIDEKILSGFYPLLSRNRVTSLPIQVTSSILRKYSSIFQALSPLIWKTINLEKYDLVISNSSSKMCNLVKVKKPVHIQYINCIPKNLFGLASPKTPQRIIPYSNLLRRFYKNALISSPYVISNSKFTQKLLYDLLNVSSTVIYPPVQIPRHLPQINRGRYFLMLTRIDRDKHIDVAVNACNTLKAPLVVVGGINDTKYKKYLDSISGPTIKFLGEFTDCERDKLNKIYADAKALIFTSESDAFGIAPVEAMAHGIPVIAYYGGGAKETIISNKNGLFFYQFSENALIEAINSFLSLRFNKSIIHQQSLRFKEENFIKKMNKYIENVSI